MNVDVSNGPEVMYGDSEKERWLNWYLTKQFIAAYPPGHNGCPGVPPDECLSEARTILDRLYVMSP